MRTKYMYIYNLIREENSLKIQEREKKKTVSTNRNVLSDVGREGNPRNCSGILSSPDCRFLQLKRKITMTTARSLHTYICIIISLCIYICKWKPS